MTERGGGRSPDPDRSTPGAHHEAGHAVAVRLGWDGEQAGRIMEDITAAVGRGDREASPTDDPRERR
jgi:hypothetical protein